MMTVEEIQKKSLLEQQLAAWRTLDIFTRWMLEHPGCSYDTRYLSLRIDGPKFELVIHTPEYAPFDFFFYGETIQDVYAQAAQTIDFNGGEL
jgi:hypothetical protein